MTASFLNTIIPWVSVASAISALLASVSIAVFSKNQKSDTIRSYESSLISYNRRYDRFFSTIDSVDKEIAHLLQSVSPESAIPEEVLLKYEAAVSKIKDLRWVIAEDVRYLRDLDPKNFDESFSLYNKLLGRLEGTHQFLDLLHERIVLRNAQKYEVLLVLAETKSSG